MSGLAVVASKLGIKGRPMPQPPSQVNLGDLRSALSAVFASGRGQRERRERAAGFRGFRVCVVSMEC